MQLSVASTGFVVGALLALWHAAWSALVAIGWAQAVIDFILHIHFISIAVAVDAFDMARAALLVGVTFGVGFVIGALFAVIWNMLHGKRAAA